MKILCKKRLFAYISILIINKERCCHVPPTIGNQSQLQLQRVFSQMQFKLRFYN